MGRIRVLRKVKEVSSKRELRRFIGYMLLEDIVNIPMFLLIALLFLIGMPIMLLGVVLEWLGEMIQLIAVGAKELAYLVDSKRFGIARYSKKAKEFESEIIRRIDDLSKKVI